MLNVINHFWQAIGDQVKIKVMSFQILEELDEFTGIFLMVKFVDKNDHSLMQLSQYRHEILNILGRVIFIVLAEAKAKTHHRN